MIPEIVSVIIDVRTGNERVVEIPKICPSCGADLTQDIGKVAIYCPNTASCPAQTSGALKSFASKHAANIDGLGEKIVDIFLEKGFLTDFPSIYRLHTYRSAILDLEGFEEKKTDNLLSAIEATRTMELARWFLALGIPEVGRKTAKLLAKHINDRAKNSEIALSTLLFSLTIEELESIRDIGPVGAESVVSYLETERTMIE